ncbi:UNVERIFIED_CONTAM: hypothetical protein EX528_06725 [Xanthomonas axonopodis]
MLGIVARQVAAACAHQLPAPQVECGADLSGSVHGDTAIDLGQGRSGRIWVRSSPCMLQAIYASASLHVLVASHRELQVLRKFRPGNAGGTMADDPPWIGWTQPKTCATVAGADRGSRAPRRAPVEDLSAICRTPTTCAPACRVEQIRPLRPAPDAGLP